jgi:WD40 repeat protein
VDTYESHKGPIYKCKFSPFDSNIFCTASADSHIGLFEFTERKPLAMLKGTGSESPIIDFAWSPQNSTVKQ